MAKKEEGVGTVMVQCTPWCIPLVDGVVKGQDGRNHRMEVAAGVHRIGARRLEDHQEKGIEVKAGTAATVVFTFE